MAIEPRHTDPRFAQWMRARRLGQGPEVAPMAAMPPRLDAAPPPAQVPPWRPAPLGTAGAGFGPPPVVGAPAAIAPPAGTPSQVTPPAAAQRQAMQQARARAQGRAEGMERPPTNDDPLRTYRILDAIFSGIARTPYDADYWRTQQDRLENRGAYAPRNFGMSPEQLELRRQQLAQADKRIGLQQQRVGLAEGREERLGQGQQFRQDITTADRDPESGASQAARDAVYRLRPELRGQFEGMSREDILKNPAAKAAIQEDLERVRLAREGKEFNRRQGVQFTYDKKAMALRDQYAQEQEARHFALEEAQRGDDKAAQFHQRYQTDLDIYSLVEEIERSPGGVPPTFLERFRNSITARGIDPDRLESWQGKHMVLELWARNQTGAAISQSEEATFAYQTGLDPAASPDQVQAAYNVLKRLETRRLRGASAAMPESAGAVMDAYGINSKSLLRGIGPSRGRRAQDSMGGGPRPGATSAAERGATKAQLAAEGWE